MICSTDTKEKLLTLIEALRSELIQIGMNEGLASNKTIEISQILDILIAEYQTLLLFLNDSSNISNVIPE